MTPPSPLTLRRETSPTPEVVAALRRVFSGAPAYSRLVVGHVSDGSTADSVFSEHPPNTSPDQKYLYGIYLADDMIGCLDAIRGWPDAGTCHIGLLLLDERYQRRGYGREAMRLLRAEVQQWSGVTTLRIGVVANNTPAFPFWRALGFAETGERKQNPAFTSDIVIMTAPLRQPAVAAVPVSTLNPTA